MYNKKSPGSGGKNYQGTTGPSSSGRGGVSGGRSGGRGYGGGAPSWNVAPHNGAGAAMKSNHSQNHSKLSSNASATTSSTTGKSTAMSITRNDTATVATTAARIPIAARFPVNSLWELTVSENPHTSSSSSSSSSGSSSSSIISGRVYCTDEISQMVVIQKALIHTTLATEIRMINVAHIVSARCLDRPIDEKLDVSDTATGIQHSQPPAIPLSQPLPQLHAKTLEDRERRALRLAEESFKHINQKVCELADIFG
jgi:hypothetical protein